MINVIHTRTFEISLLGEKYNLTEEEFRALQPECREIADFALDDSMQCIEITPDEFIPTPGFGINSFPAVLDFPEEVPDPTIEEPETEALKINAEPIDEAETFKPMDVNAIKVRIEKMESHRNCIDPYVKMHEEGKPMEAIKNQMLADNFCLQGSLSYHVKRVLAASNRVTKIELESDSETSEQTIERLKAENLANTEKRKKPRLAMK